MANIKVAVINRSSVLTDAEVQGALPAFQTQVHEHFAPAWGVDADLIFVPKTANPPPGSWWLVVLDNSDQSGALGYHDLTPEGLPLGKVFAGTDKQYGYIWTVTATHELLEMLADPAINLTVFVQHSNTNGVLYAYEVCDACEADQFGYAIGKTIVSDFVLPSWFETFRKHGSTRFDFQGHITAPLQLLKGGYIGVFDVTGGSGWGQQTAELARYSMRAPVGSRRERRRTPRDQWMLSETGSGAAGAAHLAPISPIGPMATAATPADICTAYHQFKPAAEAILPFLRAIPGIGTGIANAVEALLQALDTFCSATATNALPLAGTDPEFMAAIAAFDPSHVHGSTVNLCGVYHAVRPILAAVQPLVILIPQYGAIAGPALAALMTLLDKECPTG